MLRNLMKDQLERVSKEAVDWRDWGKQRKLSVRIDGVPAEIRTRHLSNESREFYGLGQFAQPLSVLSDLKYLSCMPHEMHFIIRRDLFPTIGYVVTEKERTVCLGCLAVLV